MRIKHNTNKYASRPNWHFRLFALISLTLVIVFASAGAAMAKAKVIYVNDHSLVKYERIEPTCRKNGWKAHYECTDCGKLFLTLEDAKKDKATPAKKVRIKKIPHAYQNKVAKKYRKKAATCTAKPVYYKSCKWCGAKNKKKTFKAEAALGHRYVLVSADNTKEVRVCTRCKKKATTTITVATPAWAGNSLVAHAGGRVKTVHNSNSVQALQQTLKSNVTSVEIDFSWTADHKLVCVHDFKEFKTGIPLLDSFLNNLFSKKYKRMTAETALKMLADSGRLYLLVDTKEENEVEVYREVLRILTEMGRVDYMEKVVPQFFSKEQYEQFKEVYPFKEGIFAIYKMQDEELTPEVTADIAHFCGENHLTVAISQKRATDQLISLLHSEHVYIIVHTVNNGGVWNTLFKKGVRSIYTDAIY